MTVTDTKPAARAVSSWAVVGCALLSLLFLWPWTHPLPAAAVSTFVFAGVQVLLPNCRPVARVPLCPWNWALLVFGFSLVVLPLSEVVGGVEIGELPRLPADSSINAALLLQTLAYLALAFTYHLLRLRPQVKIGAGKTLAWSPSITLIAMYLAIGLTGGWLFFGGWETFFTYFRDPSAYLLLDQTGSPSNWMISASTLLRPFLGFAFVLMLCRVIDSQTHRSTVRTWALSLPILAAIAISFSLFSYNRGAFVVPMLAVCAAFLAHHGRNRLALCIAAGFVCVCLLAVITVVRASHGRTDLSSSIEEWQNAGRELPFTYLVQVYGNGPQFLGFLLEETQASDLQWGRGLMAGVMSPVPVFGESFRRSSGTAFYNNLLNRGNAEDQVISFAGELYLNFHVPGIVVGFGILGAALCWLQRQFERSRTAMPRYVIQSAAIWVLFLAVGSVSVVSQIAIYFYWPVYLYLLPRFFFRAQKSYLLAGAPVIASYRPA